MRVVRGPIAPETARGAALAIGNFDGVHRGHQALLAQARARAGDGLHGALLFDPHPKEYFAPQRPHFRLTPLALKLEDLEALGAKLAVVLAFDAALAGMSAEAFIDDVLVKGLGARAIVVGHDFRFGAERRGDCALLQLRGAALGFTVDVVAPVRDATEVISSTAIRDALSRGDVAHAAALRGRPWVVRGTVHGGAKRGAGMGYPTANVTLGVGTSLAHGIYAVRVKVDGRWHDGASYLGTRPTFDNGAPVLETFLLDFDGDLYGKSIDIAFVAHIRPDRAFATSDDLVAQMNRDVEAARRALAAG
jgi:riboflavin kinase / FMN adenylyltransferase